MAWAQLRRPGAGSDARSTAGAVVFDLDSDDEELVLATASAAAPAEPPAKRARLAEANDTVAQAAGDGATRTAAAARGAAASPLEATLAAKGQLPLSLAKEIAAACKASQLPRSSLRNLVAALGRSPALAQRLASGELTPEAFVALPLEELATPAQREARRVHEDAAKRAITLDARSETFALVCDNCGEEDALGSWILSSSGGKPMLGSARMVKRGVCPHCQHVWLDEGR
eukprot:TRINITY_DN14326_c0_g1_i1.p1 TRINITY_DN14326_c0_g1~~TRINITY_DN14326_c0_g1_i1.p1  ORF type:complete len:230 (-),score=62.66 TRINITY_DN14326_c0_g1_i1:284-973(-)